VTRRGFSSRTPRVSRRSAIAPTQPVGANERYFHHDLVRLSTGDLLVEYGALLLSSLTTGVLEWWCEERLWSIRAELLSRNASSTQVLEHPSLLLLDGLRHRNLRSWS